MVCVYFVKIACVSVKRWLIFFCCCSRSVHDSDGSFESAFLAFMHHLYVCVCTVHIHIAIYLYLECEYLLVVFWLVNNDRESHIIYIRPQSTKAVGSPIWWLSIYFICAHIKYNTCTYSYVYIGMYVCVYDFHACPSLMPTQCHNFWDSFCVWFLWDVLLSPRTN